MLIIASLLLAGSMLAAHGQSDAESGKGSVTKEYKAMARPDIEALGGRDENGVIHDNGALTRGLNKLAADNWELTAIESVSTRPISGPAGASASNPAMYVFSR
jgi:hypothetical protein